jgi:cytochrome c-type biogenesis protein
VGSSLAGFAAGVLSTLSPCVLPLLPILIASAFQQSRLGPLALTLGIAFSFTAIGLLLSLFGFAIGLEQEAVRMVAASLMLAFGLVLLVPMLQRALAQVSAPLTQGGNALLARFTPQGLVGQLGLGLLLGAVWSPCTGPTLGAAIGLAAQAATAVGAGGVMLSFSLGAAVPILILAYGSRSIMARRGGMAAIGGIGKPAMGAGLAAVGLLVITGWDKGLEAWAVDAMPSWLVGLTTAI